MPAPTRREILRDMDGALLFVPVALEAAALALSRSRSDRVLKDSTQKHWIWVSSTCSDPVPWHSGMKALLTPDGVQVRITECARYVNQADEPVIAALIEAFPTRPLSTKEEAELITMGYRKFASFPTRLLEADLEACLSLPDAVVVWNLPAES